MLPAASTSPGAAPGHVYALPRVTYSTTGPTHPPYPSFVVRSFTFSAVSSDVQPLRPAQFAAEVRAPG